MRLRTCKAADLAAAHAIYAHHVAHSLGTFDETPPPLADFERKLVDLTDARLPFLVAEPEDGGPILGYAYAAPFRARTGYRYTCEDSVYVAPEHHGRGIGRALLDRLIEEARASGLRRMLALVGDSNNTASIALHGRAGFARVGVMRGVGYKHGRWLDVVVLERAL